MTNLTTSKNLGIGLIASLIITEVFPRVHLGGLDWIGTLLVLIIAIVLLVR